ncbi:hypothetical protein EU538_02695 [Candidatus Thorarchaeota archaeon]|nr:MAG: hypothetical protein EU538_02695 [Candidatus Thorarchaeota archaeon]
MTFKMRQLGIAKYGPLEDTKIDIDPTFQCIFGPNESGKTLIIDAVLKMLLPKEYQRYFGQEIQRVDGQAHGWILVDIDGDEYELSDSKDIDESIQLDLQSLRDLLVVRNSDLHMFDQASCLDRATDLMMGLRTGEIEIIQEELRNRGQLTEKRMDISAEGGPGSAKNQLDAAKNLLQSIGEYLKGIEEDEVVRRESRIIDLSAQYAELRNEQEELDEARKLGELQKLKGALSKGRAASKKIGVYPAGFKEEAGKAFTRYQEIQVGYDRLRNKKQAIGRWLLAVTVSMSILGLASILLNAGLFGLLQSLVSAALFVFLLVYWWRVSRQVEAIEATRTSLVNVARRLNSSVTDADSAADFIDAELRKIGELEEERERSIGAIESLLSMGSIEQEQAFVRAEGAIKEQESTITKDVHREYDETEYSMVKKNLIEIEQELEQVKKENENHKEKLREFDRHLQGLRFGEYLGRPREYNPVSVDSLLRVKEELHEFITAIEDEAASCRKAIDIFETLAREEQKKVARLLSENTRASEIFSDITAGRYVRITYDPTETEKLKVVKEDGTELNVLGLSRGTKDQMYLAIRLALAESILQGESGFFIFDDPFLASDLDRRSMQIEALQRMVKNGWQIVYFTANKNVAEELKSKTGHDYLTLPALP